MKKQGNNGALRDDCSKLEIQNNNIKTGILTVTAMIRKSKETTRREEEIESAINGSNHVV